jgi:predicted nicotinamide N-methyase
MFVSRNSTVLSLSGAFRQTTCRCHLGGKIRAVISARAWLLSCIIDEFTACLSSRRVDIECVVSDERSAAPTKMTATKAFRHAPCGIYRHSSHLAMRRERRERRARREARSNRQHLKEMPPLPNGKALSIRSRGLKNAESVGLGGKLWPAAAKVCRWLRGQSLAGKSVYELGSGTGAVGLYAAALGAADVTLTDGGGQGVLSVAKENLERNRALIASAARVHVLEHRWGEGLEKIPPRADLVLACDCTYSRGAHRALCKSIRWLLDPTPGIPRSLPPHVVVAHQRRTFFASGDMRDDLVHFCSVASASGLRVAPLDWGDDSAAQSSFHDEVILLDVKRA